MRFQVPFIGAVVILLASLSFASAPASSGPENSEDVASLLQREKLDLADLLRLADLSSPAMTAARRGVVAAENRARQAGAFANPTLELEAENIPADDARLSHGERSIGVSWPVDVLSRGGRVAAARGGAEADAHDREVERRAVQRKILEAACAVIRLRDASTKAKEARASASKLDDIARMRFEVRAEPKTHAHAARIERASVDAESTRLQAEERAAVLELEALLGCAGLDSMQLERGAMFDLEWARTALAADLPSQNPRILAARARRDAAKGASSVANRAWLPEPELRVAWGVDPADDEFVEAGAAIPIPLFDRGRSEAAGARAEAERAEAELRATSAALAAERAGAIARWSAARESVQLHRETVAPIALEAFELAMEGYDAGRLPFLELLDALRTLAEVQRAQLDLQAEHDAAAAALFELAPTSEGETR